MCTSHPHMYRIYNEEMCARSISKKKVFSIPITIASEKFTLMTEILIHKARFYMMMADERVEKAHAWISLNIFRISHFLPLFIKQKLLTIFLVISNSANFQSRTHSLDACWAIKWTILKEMKFLTKRWIFFKFFIQKMLILVTKLT